MKPLGIVAALGLLVVVSCTPGARSTDDAAAVTQAVRNLYSAYSGFDEQAYRATTTEDYALLEQGELIDREGDVASMPKPDHGFKRTDVFDFRSVTIEGNIAWAVYLVKSEIHDDIKGTRQREWLESAILRRTEGPWRMALLHSTRIQTPIGVQDLKSFAVRYTAAWCSQDPASVAAFFAENGSLKINDGEPSVGRAAITAAARGFMSDFPDLVVEMDALEQAGDGYIYRWTLTGTNSGPGGKGNKVRISGYEEWTIGANGLISRSLGHFDSVDYQRQLNGE